MKPTVIDLFCGAGGLSEGFRQAGFKIILGIDNDVRFKDTFVKNFPEASFISDDIRNVSATRILKTLNIKRSEIDVIVGGPPCQGFSLTGPRKFEDPRNSLYLSFYKIVEEIKPKAFVIENVRGIATLYNGAVKDDIIQKFEDIGYNVSMRVLNAANYGVPQIRHRVFFVGVLEKFGEFNFPESIRSPKNYTTCEEAIGDLPPLNDSYLGEDAMKYIQNPISKYQKEMRKGMTTLHNHTATIHTDYVKRVISLVPEGGNHKDLPKGVGTSRKFNEAWTRYHSKKPSRTIDTGHRNHFHYKWDRVPTVRENARLQSFPDIFIFFGNKTSQQVQVGNAVPPMLAFNIATKLKENIGDTQI